MPGSAFRNFVGTLEFRLADIKWFKWQFQQLHKNTDCCLVSGGTISFW